MGRLNNPNIVPLGLAIQALALFVAALFLTPGSTSSPSATGAGGQAGDTADALTSLAELPRDLQREMLPVARVPEREDRTKPPQPTPADDGSDSLSSDGPKLANLRIQSVALSGPIASPISAPMLGIPDSLTGLTLASGAWLGGGSESSRRRGSRTGGGPSGIAGTGGGMGGGSGGSGGGYCPTPGRVGGGGGGRPSGGGGATSTGGSGGSGRPRGGGGTTRGTTGSGSRGRPAGSGGSGAVRGKK